MEPLEISARTVEEAIKLALEQLSVSREEVNVVVLSEGKSGILGLGAEEARIRVEPLKSMPEQENDIATIAREVLEKLLSLLDVEGSVVSDTDHVVDDEVGLNCARHLEEVLRVPKSGDFRAVPPQVVEPKPVYIAVVGQELTDLPVEAFRGEVVYVDHLADRRAKIVGRPGVEYNLVVIQRADWFAILIQQRSKRWPGREVDGRDCRIGNLAAATSDRVSQIGQCRLGRALEPDGFQRALQGGFGRSGEEHPVGAQRQKASWRTPYAQSVVA